MIIQPRDTYFWVSKLRLHYLECGDEAARPMVLLHGTADNAHVWDHLAPYVLNHFRIIALDQRGHGDSDWAIPPAYGCNDYVGDLASLIEALRLTDVVLVGHSMGALHATRYASMIPDKVAGLIHTDIEPCPPPWNRKYLSGLYDTLPHSYNSIQDFVDFLRKNSPYAKKEMLTTIASHSLNRGEDGKFYQKIDREVLRRFDQYDLRPHLSAIKCPTLIIRGKESRVMRREMALAMDRAISNSKFMEIPQATHPVLTDNPFEFCKVVVDFLENVGLLAPPRRRG